MQEGYRLVSYADGRNAVRAGILVDGRAVAARDILDDSFQSVIDILRAWDEAHPRISAAIGSGISGRGIPLAELKLLAPILYPGAFFCAGANYWDHLEEMAEIAKRTTGKAPSMTRAPNHGSS